MIYLYDIFIFIYIYIYSFIFIPSYIYSDSLTTALLADIINNINNINIINIDIINIIVCSNTDYLTLVVLL